MRLASRASVKEKVLHTGLRFRGSDSRSRTVLRIPAGAQRQIVLKLTEQEHILDITVEDGAALDIICIQAPGAHADVRIWERCTVGAGSRLHVCNATLGGSIEHSLVSHITGSNSESSIDWVFYGRGEDRLRLSVKNLFDASGGQGEITVKGVAEGKAHCRCDGMIEITESGRGTDTYLTETMLMLDGTARCDAVPALEIRTNDVRASHSATVTKVSEEDLFYFGARGIPETEARRMLVEGFLTDLLQRFPRSARESVLLFPSTCTGGLPH
jgi:Fe-S cluster assembly scaffold protein SufB